MADNFGCKKCGYKETEHEVVQNMRLGMPEFLPVKPPFKKAEIERVIKEEYPGICREYKPSREEIAFRKKHDIDE